MSLNRNYWQILEKIGGAKMSTHIGGVGPCEELNVDIIKFLKDNNKRFKKQEEEKPLEGPEYE